MKLSVNWHMTERCNYKCKFCFSKYGNAREICNDIEKSKVLISKLWENNIEKINFTGGEPLLCKNLGEIIKYAKTLGMVTSIVTNGYYFSKKIGYNFIMKYGNYIDWIGLSVDSGNENTELQLGRGYGDHVKRIKRAVKLIRDNYNHIGIKINTVVTKLNYNEDMHELINELNPSRWKVFQLKIIPNVNEASKNLAINDEEFKLFIDTHEDLNPIWEDNNLMTYSYLMIDPYGRFYEDEDRIQNPRPSLIDVEFNEAMKDLKFDIDKYIKRGGWYNWVRI